MYTYKKIISSCFLTGKAVTNIESKEIIQAGNVLQSLFKKHEMEIKSIVGSNISLLSPNGRGVE